MYEHKYLLKIKAITAPPKKRMSKGARIYFKFIVYFYDDSTGLSQNLLSLIYHEKVPSKGFHRGMAITKSVTKL